MIIYKATNKINGKVYIGQTTRNIDVRKMDHIYSANSNNGYYFHNAIVKYGIDNFNWDIIDECNNIDELNLLEEQYIVQYDSMNEKNGYNLTSGGKNFTMSDVIRQKLKDCSKHLSGKDNPFYGKKHTDKSKQKQRLIKLGKNNPRYGVIVANETKQKMKDAWVKRKVSSKYKESKKLFKSKWNKTHNEKLGDK